MDRFRQMNNEGALYSGTKPRAQRALYFGFSSSFCRSSFLLQVFLFAFSVKTGTMVAVTGGGIALFFLAGLYTCKVKGPAKYAAVRVGDS